MPAREVRRVRLRSLVVRDFKALDFIEMEFPPPKMRDDPDVVVMGSKNGLGKTSLLESCAILFLAAAAGEDGLRLDPPMPMPVNLSDLLVRSGAEGSTIDGVFDCGKQAVHVKVSLPRKGPPRVKGNREPLRKLVSRVGLAVPDAASGFLLSLTALSSEPLFLPPFMYFHSYRKVQEGNPELSMMVEPDRSYRTRRRWPGAELPMSTFKLEILRSMMSRAELFEGLHDERAQEALEKLNELVRAYAGGVIEKLRPSPDNTIEFRIKPDDGRPSFAFDGLSSGQKEIISTLFLIWRYTRRNPGIILIDEPELHLNVEWHRGFVEKVHQLAPDNQYIIATHSEDIFGSVAEDRRRLLTPGREAKR